MKTPVEFVQYSPSYRNGINEKGKILINNDSVLENISNGDFGKLLDKVDKRLFAKYVEGAYFLLLTEKQLTKLKSLIN